ncbi:MAG TPA: methylated-DNA--[protein]-cysteine S-methyltransferase [Chloroflexota bacterium]|nr:methylated-DNA--[protein]-cysteine S-methyltransferase [Chloroflexota bacterium]
MVAKGGRAGNGHAVVARAETGSPIGPLALYGTNEGLMAIVFPRHSRVQVEAWLSRVIGRATIVDNEQAHEETIGQLEEYFAGKRREFELELDVRGTAFQQRVWEAVRAVPHGQTRSYREVAAAVGQPRAVRAVGAANGANPLPLVIPCHRIIGSSGGLHGYGGGLDVKAKLLELEGARVGSPSA